MEGTYGVYFGKQMMGKVQVIRQGLYYRFLCRCQLTGDVVCRLLVSCNDARESLGIVVPMSGGFGLETRLPVKRLGEGEMSFTLVPKCDLQNGRFIPIYPDEPFEYIEKLKDAYLTKREGQLGIVI